MDSFAYTEITLFIETMRNIFEDETFGVSKYILGVIEGNTMFFDVKMVFGFAPLKFHKPFIMHVCIIVNTIVLINVWGGVIARYSVFVKSQVWIIIEAHSSPWNSIRPINGNLTWASQNRGQSNGSV